MMDYYSPNGGTVMGIAGQNYAVICSDSRYSCKGSIISNNQLKIFQLKNYTAIGLSGNFPDIFQVFNKVEEKITEYENIKGKIMSLNKSAQMISVLLYERRIFPYLVQVILVGIDDQGRGGVYSFDPVGHCEKVAYRLHGTSARSMSSSVSYTLGRYEKNDIVNIEAFQLTTMLKDIYGTCCEVDAATGDHCEIWILKKNYLGNIIIEKYFHELRKD